MKDHLYRSKLYFLLKYQLFILKQHFQKLIYIFIEIFNKYNKIHTNKVIFLKNFYFKIVQLCTSIKNFFFFPINNIHNKFKQKRNSYLKLKHLFIVFILMFNIIWICCLFLILIFQIIIFLFFNLTFRIFIKLIYKFNKKLLITFYKVIKLFFIYLFSPIFFIIFFLSLYPIISIVYLIWLLFYFSFFKPIFIIFYLMFQEIIIVIYKILALIYKNAFSFKILKIIINFYEKINVKYILFIEKIKNKKNQNKEQLKLIILNGWQEWKQLTFLRNFLFILLIMIWGFYALTFEGQIEEAFFGTRTNNRLYYYWYYYKPLFTDKTVFVFFVTFPLLVIWIITEIYRYNYPKEFIEDWSSYDEYDEDGNLMEKEKFNYEKHTPYLRKVRDRLRIKIDEKIDTLQLSPENLEEKAKLKYNFTPVQFNVTSNDIDNADQFIIDLKKIILQFFFTIKKKLFLNSLKKRKNKKINFFALIQNKCFYFIKKILKFIFITFFFFLSFKYFYTIEYEILLNYYNYIKNFCYLFIFFFTIPNEILLNIHCELIINIFDEVTNHMPLDISMFYEQKRYAFFKFIGFISSYIFFLYYFILQEEDPEKIKIIIKFFKNAFTIIGKIIFSLFQIKKAIFDIDIDEFFES